MSKEIKNGIPGNELADSRFGRFIAWAGEQPVGVQLLAPGVIVAIAASLFGVPLVGSAVAGGVTSVGTYLVAIKAQA